MRTRLILGIATVITLFINGSSQTAISQTTSNPTVGPADDVAPCEGRYIHTYYDSSRGDSVGFSLSFLSSIYDETGAVLKGFLYLPGHSNVANSPKKLPLIIYAHGSGATVSDACAMATYFTDNGFAFFIPHRRGHGLSTGQYYTDFLDQLCERTAEEPFGFCGIVLNNTFLLAYLKDQTFETAQAVSYLKTLKNSADKPIIDPDKIAIMGHSFGGMVALFNNDLLTSHKAVINIAGASESWQYFDEEDGLNTPDKSNSITILKDAVRGANQPIFFLEPKNDVSLKPTIIFSRVAGNEGDRYQAAIYGPVPNVSSTEEAHGLFVTDPNQVKKWGPAVLEFLSRHGVK